MRNKCDNTNNVDQDVVDKLSHRFKRLNDEQKRNLQRFLFTDDYPLDEFVDSILNIENLQVRFNTFYAVIDAVTYQRARGQLYFILINADRTDTRRPQFRTCDPRAVIMFQKLPDSINLSLELLSDALKKVAIVQLTVNKLETGFKYMGNRLMATNPITTPATSKKRKNEDSSLSNSKRQKVENIAHNTEFVEKVWNIYDSAPSSVKAALPNFDEYFWNKLHEIILQSTNPFETFYQSMLILTQQEARHRFLRIFLSPPGEWKGHPGEIPGNLSLYEPSRDLLSPKSNKNRVIDLLTENADRPFKRHFTDHLCSKNLVRAVDDYQHASNVHLENQLFFGEKALEKHFPLAFQSKTEDKNIPCATAKDFAKYFSFWENTDKNWKKVDPKLDKDKAPLANP